MASPDKVLITGRQLAFWAITPFLAICAFLPAFLPPPWTPFKIVFAAIWPMTCVLGMLALYDPKKFRWAGRCVAGVIFLAYLGFAVNRLILTSKPREPEQRRSRPAPGDAFLGFIIIGLPSLWFAIFGTFVPGQPDAKSPASLPKPDPNTDESAADDDGGAEVVPEIDDADDQSRPSDTHHRT